MIKNLFLFVSLFGIGYLSMTNGLNKSTLNQCTNNNDDNACTYLIKHGSNYQKNIATLTLLNRGL
jgi:hypothetical protein|tara:strand:- start:374 stop:568 length:195 start_codon:yes stop_codon:yes gene_type:complete